MSAILKALRKLESESAPFPGKEVPQRILGGKFVPRNSYWPKLRPSFFILFLIGSLMAGGAWVWNLQPGFKEESSVEISVKGSYRVGKAQPIQLDCASEAKPQSESFEQTKQGTRSDNGNDSSVVKVADVDQVKSTDPDNDDTLKGATVKKTETSLLPFDKEQTGVSQAKPIASPSLEKETETEIVQVTMEEIPGDSEQPSPARIVLDDHLEPLDRDILSLQALVWAQSIEKRMVVVNNRVLRIGGQVDDYVILEIAEDHIVVEKGTSRWIVAFSLK